ncbi:TIGR04086 family membrane protein [Aquibacillus koreensis]|uniref:TIGR04086 family membrane protein n=1 Tax=Aquibacillus koreensis TaxID=279446 RepID=A0A9X3WIS3_9BACI|nr:TIGR04086 family membrane protein [Aquibacillus koreensis]MCT2537988.1 TIGR04086 family membrane protein [Aquibacillus koreensis]MDC3419121.1 TIGR04086 family membrane protein [Aquibacillus koreensis]
MAQSRIIALLWGWVVVFGVMLLASLILAMLLRFTSLGASTLSWTTLVISLIALFVGGLVAGLKGKEKGWILGGLTGLGFTLFILLYQYLGYSSGFSLAQLLHHGGFLLAALFGGVMGVNMSSNQESR